MGQNTSQQNQSRSTLIHNWSPHQTEPNILVNKVTNEQVQRHFIKILIKDLPRQIALFATRMSNHQANISRLLYFHPAVPDPHGTRDQSSFRQMYLYTDKMLLLKSWSKEKLMVTLQALRRLVSIHGPMKITQGMLCENQSGQAKIWISTNPVNNHPDSKYMSQEQTVADLASILAKKNKELASQMMGCHTLRDVSEKLAKTLKDNGQSYSNYSHRASESSEIKFKTFDFIQKPPNLSQYRNVFDDKSKGKIVENVKQNNRRTQQDQKPISNISYIPKAQEKYASKKSAIDQNYQRKQTKKNISYEPRVQFKNRKMEGTQQDSSKLGNSNINDNTVRSTSKFQFKQSKIQGKGSGSPKFKRFETNYQFGISPHNFASQKGLKTNVWQPHQHQNSFGTFKNESGVGDKSFIGAKEQNKSKSKSKGYDITIINNNVSNYINNVVHNHVTTLQKKQSDHNHNKTQKQQDQTSHLHSSQKEEPINWDKQKEKPNFVPNFIQQKKKTNFVHGGSPERTQADSSGSLTRQNTGTSNNQKLNNFIESHVDFLEKKSEVNSPSYNYRTFERKTQKIPTFSRPINSTSPFKYLKTIKTKHPKTPPVAITGDSSFGAYQKKDEIKEQFLGNRTKTTDFHQNRRQIRQKVNQNLPIKGFTKVTKESQYYQISQSIKNSQPQKARALQGMTLSPEQKQKAQMKRSHTPEQKSQMKKQLRKQFTFLLGGDSPKKDQGRNEEEPATEYLNKSQVTEVRKEGEVKEKIKKKKIEFAQLKKQAQQLLF